MWIKSDPQKEAAVETRLLHPPVHLTKRNTMPRCFLASRKFINMDVVSRAALQHFLTA